VEGSSSLTRLIKDVAKIVKINTADSPSVLDTYKQQYFGLLGDGSDYTGFIQ
jgi:hypothetical protein